MRRSDRQVENTDTILEIISACNCCRIGFSDNDEVYIVPMSFGFEYSNGTLTLWFHSAPEGRKITLSASSPNVGFEMDTGYDLHASDIPCSFSTSFSSVIGTGTISLVSTEAEKRRGLRLIMEHTAGTKPEDFPSIEKVAVLRLDVKSFSCKHHD